MSLVNISSSEDNERYLSFLISLQWSHIFVKEHAGPWSLSGRACVMCWMLPLVS